MYENSSTPAKFYEAAYRSGKPQTREGIEVLHRYRAMGPETYMQSWRRTSGTPTTRFFVRQGNRRVIRNIEVDPDKQMQGFATNLFRHAARHLGSTVDHDERMMHGGESWAKKVGGPRHGDPSTRKRFMY